MLEWYIFLVQAVDLKPQKTEEVACVAGQRKNGRARGRHARGEGGPARKAHENRSTRILWVWIFPIGREAPEGKINHAGRENCQSIVHRQRSEGLRITTPAPETTKWYNQGGRGVSKEICGIASVTFKMASKVLIEESDENVDFITEILFRFLGFGDFKFCIVKEN